MLQGHGCPGFHLERDSRARTRTSSAGTHWEPTSSFTWVLDLQIMPLQQNISPFQETVKGAIVFELFNQAQGTVTEVLSEEQSNMPSASPWELAWNEFPAPSLVPETLCTYGGRRDTPKTGHQTVLLRTSDYSPHRKEQQILLTPQLSHWYPHLHCFFLLSRFRSLFLGTLSLILGTDLSCL